MAHASHWSTGDTWAVILLLWFFGGGIAAWLRRVSSIRHRRRVELALAQRGMIVRSSWHPAGSGDDDRETVVPAAVIPAPPGAKAARGVPGRCRHERLLPVLDKDGGLQRWICANYERCDAEFPPDTAIYEPGEGLT